MPEALFLTKLLRQQLLVDIVSGPVARVDRCAPFSHLQARVRVRGQGCHGGMYPVCQLDRCAARTPDEDVRVSGVLRSCRVRPWTSPEKLHPKPSSLCEPCAPFTSGGSLPALGHFGVKGEHFDRRQDIFTPTRLNAPCTFAGSDLLAATQDRHSSAACTRPVAVFGRRLRPGEVLKKNCRGFAGNPSCAAINT